MSDAREEAQKSVADLQTQLKSMPVNMRLFSVSMRALYSYQANGGSTEAAKKFRKLRDDTRNDAMVYLEGILPLTTEVVRAISGYFEFFEALDYDAWCRNLSDIHQETISYKQLCNTLMKMHEVILVPLKSREDQARVIVEEMKHLKQEFEKKKKELEERASTKRSWAIALAFVPRLNALITPFLVASAESDLASAIAKGAEAEVQEATSITISYSLIPALQDFIHGISKAAAFFSVMEQELANFQENAEKGMSDKKKLYYDVMLTEAREIKNLCQIFYAVLPDVRTDFLAIPTEGTDKNYIDEWLEKQKETIRQNCSVGKLMSRLLKAITGPGEE